MQEALSTWSLLTLIGSDTCFCTLHHRSRKNIMFHASTVVAHQRIIHNIRWAACREDMADEMFG